MQECIVSVMFGNVLIRGYNMIRLVMGIIQR